MSGHTDAGPAFDPGQLAQLLVHLGCPAGKAPEMAGQLLRRSAQLAEQKGCSPGFALSHLLNLMQQGWSARERGIS